MENQSFKGYTANVIKPDVKPMSFWKAVLLVASIVVTIAAGILMSLPALGGL